TTTPYSSATSPDTDAFDRASRTSAAVLSATLRTPKNVTARAPPAARASASARTVARVVARPSSSAAKSRLTRRSDPNPTPPHPRPPHPRRLRQEAPRPPPRLQLRPLGPPPQDPRPDPPGGNPPHEQPPAPASLDAPARSRDRRGQRRAVRRPHLHDTRGQL